jgi:hypothetical protein
MDVARALATAQEEAQAAARSATARYNSAVAAVDEAGATAIMKIRTQAESTDNPHIYSLARIPAIAKRSPVAEPGTPYSLKVELDSNGSLILTWKCKNPKGSTGTTYRLNRSIDDGPFVYLGISGEKEFADNKIPAGAKNILYEIRAMRSTKAGTAEIFPVSLCSNGIATLLKFQSPTSKIMLAA